LISRREIKGLVNIELKKGETTNHAKDSKSNKKAEHTSFVIISFRPQPVRFVMAGAKV